MWPRDDWIRGYMRRALFGHCLDFLGMASSGVLSICCCQGCSRTLLDDELVSFWIKQSRHIYVYL